MVKCTEFVTAVEPLNESSLLCNLEYSKSVLDSHYGNKHFIRTTKNALRLLGIPLSTALISLLRPAAHYTTKTYPLPFVITVTTSLVTPGSTGYGSY